jgi:hypothetical protein
VLNQDADIAIVLNYTDLPEANLIDVKDATVRVIKKRRKPK